MFNSPGYRTVTVLNVQLFPASPGLRLYTVAVSDSPISPAAPPALAPSPWLSPAESRAWRAFLMASQLLMDQLDRELQHAADMPHTYYGILVVLSEQPER